MKPRLSRFLIPALLLFATLVVSLTTVLAYQTLNTLDYSQYWVDHTWEVMNQVERIMGSAKDAETGVRGFLLTGDDAYLAPYNQALQDLPRGLDRFQLLTRDNASQRARVIVLRATVEERLSLLSDFIALRRENDSDGVRAMILSGTA